MAKFYKTEKAAKKYCKPGYRVVTTNKGFMHEVDPAFKGTEMPKPAPAPHVVSKKPRGAALKPVHPHKPVPETEREVTMTEATNYANIVLRRAFEYLADMDQADFADRDDAHQMLTIKQLSEAMMEVPERALAAKLEAILARLMVEGPAQNPRLVTKLCRNLAKGFTSQIYSADLRQEEMIRELVESGVAPDEAEAQAREPNNYPGAVDDITDPRFRPSANLVRHAAEDAYELLDKYFGMAELAYVNRANRLGTLPWATFLIDPNVPALGFHQELDLDKALRWKAAQAAQRIEDQREKDQNALRLVAGIL